jgi:hypothetical protein
MLKKPAPETQTQPRTFRDLVNTPFKKAMFVIQIISYVLIVGSPVIGGLIGRILFYGSLAFLGKEVVLLVRDKLKTILKRRKKRS